MGVTKAEARPKKPMDWFALTVKPQHERSVAEQLAAKSLEGYVPLYRTRRLWSDRRKTVELPLFPRYVFCRFRFEDRLKVLSTLSVISIVGFGGTPCPVTDKEIDVIKRMIDSNLPIMPWPFLRIGQHVQIRQGPLSGLEGILAKEKAAYRVVVNVEMLQRAVAVEIERDLLEAIGGTQKEPFQSQSAQRNLAASAEVDRTL
jgi:transcription antitermination factor NusG